MPPKSGGCCGNASPGTNAFAGMGRSYKSSSRSHGSWCIHRQGIHKGHSPCGYALRPSRRGPLAREAAMARSYGSLAHSGVR